MIINQVFIVLIILNSFLNSFSQVSIQDSLKIRSLDKEARSKIFKEKTKALELCDKAIALSKKDSSIILIPLSTKALIYFQHGKKDSALNIMQLVIDISTATKDDKSLSGAYRNIGQIEEYTGSFDDALKNYMLANEVYRRSSEYDGNPGLYMAIADLHLRLEDLPKAEENYRKGLLISPLWKDDKLIASFQVKLAKVFLYKEELDSAYYYAKQADDFFISSNLKPSVNDPKEVLAEINLKKGKTDEAIKYYDNLLKTLINQKDTRRIAFIAQKLGVAQLKQLDYKAALKTYELSLDAHEKLQSPAIADDYKMLAYIHEQNGNYNLAYDFQKKYSDKYKELLNKEKLNQINDLQIKYDTEKKERENEQLSFSLTLKEKESKIAESSLMIKNYVIIGIVVLFLVFMGLIFLIYNRRKVINDNNMLKLEQKLLKTQMNPHFISNALMSAQGYIYDNKPKEASSYLTKIAKLTRLVLENSRKESISLEDEISTLENYLVVQQKRYENFDFELTVDEKLDPEEIQLPPMLTQPFVENAIEHGVQNLPYRGLLKVNFTSTNQNKLHISIADNGLGITKNITPKKEHQSLSSKIVKERLNNLAEFYKEKLDFNISNNFTDKNKGEGTKVVLTLPLYN